MKNLQLPSSYAMISEEEQRSVCGGGELGDALDDFFQHMHLDDFFFGSGLISFSFTFVPMLLFKVVATGFDVTKTIYDDVSRLLGFSSSTSSADAQTYVSGTLYLK